VRGDYSGQANQDPLDPVSLTQVIGQFSGPEGMTQGRPVIFSLRQFVLTIGRGPATIGQVNDYHQTIADPVLHFGSPGY
jgi:hypothetical protein